MNHMLKYLVANPDKGLLGYDQFGLGGQRSVGKQAGYAVNGTGVSPVAGKTSRGEPDCLHAFYHGYGQYGHAVGWC